MAKVDLDKAFQFVKTSGEPILSALAAYAVGKQEINSDHKICRRSLIGKATGTS